MFRCVAVHLLVSVRDLTTASQASAMGLYYVLLPMVAHFVHVFTIIATVPRKLLDYHTVGPYLVSLKD